MAAQPIVLRSRLRPTIRQVQPLRIKARISLGTRRIHPCTWTLIIIIIIIIVIIVIVVVVVIVIIIIIIIIILILALDLIIHYATIRRSVCEFMHVPRGHEKEGTDAGASRMNGSLRPLMEACVH
jgi:hypothetical protein